ncbi:hypothetical protein DNTS_033052, partial [Danionella cerebrum]
TQPADPPAPRDTDSTPVTAQPEMATVENPLYGVRLETQPADPPDPQTPQPEMNAVSTESSSESTI